MFAKISNTFRDFINTTSKSGTTQSRKRKINEDYSEAGQSPAKRHKPNVLTSEGKPPRGGIADWVVNTRKTFSENYYFRKIINSPKDFYHSVTGRATQSATKSETPLCAPQFNPLQTSQQSLPYMQPSVVAYTQQMAYPDQNMDRSHMTSQGQCNTPRSQFSQGYSFSKSSMEVPRTEAFAFARTKDSFTFNAPRPPPPASAVNNRYPLTSQSSSNRPTSGSTAAKPKTVYDKMYKSSGLRGIKLRNKLAARESIRIQEKDTYARLLQQFTSEPIPGSAFGNSQLRRSSGIQYRSMQLKNELEPRNSQQESSLSMERIRGDSTYPDSRASQSTTKIQVEPRKSLLKSTARSSVFDLTGRSEVKPVVIDLTSDVSGVQRPDLSERSFLDIQALRRKKQEVTQKSERHRNTPTESLFAQSTPLTSRLRMSPTAKSTPASPVFTDAVSPSERDLTIPPIPCSPAEELLSKSLSESKYMQDDWIDDMKTKYCSEKRRKARLIQEEQIKCSFLKERRDAFEEEVEEHLRKKLSLIQREPPVLEEITLVEEPEEEESNEFIALSEDQEESVDDALRPGPGGQVLSEGFKLQITRTDMATLSGLNWLNDEIINFYMNMLMERGTREDFPSVHAFNTFFYQKLIGSGHSGVRRWTKRVDVFAMDYILVPVHLGMHWCLAVVDFRKKEIRYYDSMGGMNNQCLNALKQYLEDESMDKKKQAYSTSDWKLMNMKDIPQQMNGSDCGMFACKFAEYASRDADITFTQEHMPYFRRRMVLEILERRFMGESN